MKLQFHCGKLPPSVVLGALADSRLSARSLTGQELCCSEASVWMKVGSLKAKLSKWCHFKFKNLHLACRTLAADIMEWTALCTSHPNRL